MANENIYAEVFRNVPGLTMDVIKKHVPAWENNSAETNIIIALDKSGLFDEEYYISQNPDVAKSAARPLSHWVEYGRKEGRKFKINNLEKTSGGMRIYRQGIEEMYHHMPLFVHWVITNMCNYRCSYCIGMDKSKTNFSTLENIKTCLDNIRSLNREMYYFTFTGGEPTLHPHLYDAIHYVKEIFDLSKINEMVIATNGSRQSDLYDKLTTIVDGLPFNLLVSIHPEYAELSHLLEIVEKLANKTHIEFNILFKPSHFNFCKMVFAVLKEMRMVFPFDIKIKLIKTGANFEYLDPEYKEEHLAWREDAIKLFNNTARDSKENSGWKIRKAYKKFWDISKNGKRQYESNFGFDRDMQFKNGLYDFKGMYCSLATNVLAISPDGSSRGAICRHYFTNYNIFKENPYLHRDFVAPFQCQLERCGCLINDLLAKFENKMEAEAYCNVFWEKQKALIDVYAKNNMVNQQN